MRDVAGQWIVENLWKIVCAIGGAVVGGVAGYTSVAIQIADLRHTAADLKQSVSQLATQRELEDAKERISTLESRLDYATQQAGTTPVPRRRR